MGSRAIQTRIASVPVRNATLSNCRKVLKRCRYRRSRGNPAATPRGNSGAWSQPDRRGRSAAKSLTDGSDSVVDAVHRLDGSGSAGTPPPAEGIVGPHREVVCGRNRGVITGRVHRAFVSSTFGREADRASRWMPSSAVARGETATTSKEGSRRANYPILIRGGSDNK